jgi:hypothetical protein
MTGPFLTPDFGLPDDLRKEIDASVQRFEDSWGAMKALAKANGWLEKYRAEVTDMVRKAYLRGVAEPKQ